MLQVLAALGLAVALLTQAQNGTPEQQRVAVSLATKLVDIASQYIKVSQTPDIYNVTTEKKDNVSGVPNQVSVSVPEIQAPAPVPSPVPVSIVKSIEIYNDRGPNPGIWNYPGRKYTFDSSIIVKNNPDGRPYIDYPVGQNYRESDNLYFRFIVYDQGGNSRRDLTCAVTTPDKEQDWVIKGTGNAGWLYGPSGNHNDRKEIFYYPFNYALRSAGDHTVTITCEGVSKSVTVTATSE